MEAFGIELRRFGDRKNFYREVDLVLSKIGSSTGVSKALACSAIAHSLQKMFRTEKYFSVSDVQMCAELAQIVIPKERLTLYRSIHCLDWNQMLPEFRQNVIALVMDDFRTIFEEAA